jgi:hypothetical protein
MTVLRVALAQWADHDDGRDLHSIMRSSMAELRGLTAAG